MQVEHMHLRDAVALHSDVLQSLNDLFLYVKGCKAKVLKDIGKLLLVAVKNFFVVGHV